MATILGITVFSPFKAQDAIVWPITASSSTGGKSTMRRIPCPSEEKSKTDGLRLAEG